MRSLRRSCLVLTLALSTAASACKKEGDSAGGGGATGAVGGDLNVVPKDSDVVFGIDMAQAKGSALFKEFGAKVLENAASEIGEFKSSCGFDPIEVTKSILMGVKVLPGDKVRGSIVVHSSVPKDKVMACLEKQKADMEAKGNKLTIDGDIAFITPKNDDGHGAITGFGNDGIVVLINDRPWTKDSVKQALAGDGSIKKNDDFTGAHGALKKSQSLWFYVNGNMEGMQMLKSQGIDAKSIFGTVHATDGLAAEVRARLASSEAATSAAKMAEGQLGQAKMFVPNIKVAADGKDLKINVELSNKELKSLLSFAGGMLGGGRRGGGMPTPDMAPEPPEAAPEAAPEAPAQ